MSAALVNKHLEMALERYNLLGDKLDKDSQHMEEEREIQPSRKRVIYQPRRRNLGDAALRAPCLVKNSENQNLERVVRKKRKSAQKKAQFEQQLEDQNEISE
jgi:hypothetical protein